MICQAHKPKAELRPIRPSDIPEVVDIHFRNLSPNTDRRFHERALYPTICHPASTGFGFVQIRDAKVVGYVVGMLDTSAWRWTLVRTRALECLLAATRLCLSKWGAFFRAVKRARYLMTNSSKKPVGHLFALAIDEAYHGLGFGVKLVQAFLDYCHLHGIIRLRWMSPKANRAVRMIALHFGGHIEKELIVSRETHVVYCFDFDKAEETDKE